MDRSDPDYAAFLDRLPTLRRLRSYVPRVHHFTLTTGAGDSLDRIAAYYEQVGSIRNGNRQTLRRLVALVDYVCAGKSPEEAIELAWHDFPAPP